MGRPKGGYHLAKNMSCVAVAHLHQGGASVLHRIAQLPFAQGHLNSVSIKNIQYYAKLPRSLSQVAAKQPFCKVDQRLVYINITLQKAKED